VNQEQTQREYDFPNRISRIILRSMRDVIGENGMSTVLNTGRLAHWIDVDPPANFDAGLTFREVGDLFEALEAIYGVRNGLKLAKQAGHESFKYWIQGFGSVIGFADFVLRFLPLSLRTRIGIEVLADIFNSYTGLQVSLGEGSERYFFTLEPGGFCWGRHTDAPACGYVVGLIEEVLFWISRGRQFTVEETSCIACGDPICTFTVDKQTL
jgi:predicted hydrocarbon binding protein